VEVPQPLQVSTYEFIVEHFSLPEIRLLYFRLGVEYDSQVGGKELKALYLIDYFRMRERFDRLLGELPKMHRDDLQSAQVLLKEASLYALQLVESGDEEDKEQATAIFEILRSVTCLEDQLCPALESRVQNLLAGQAWGAAWDLLGSFRGILPGLEECIDGLLKNHPRSAYERADEAEKRKRWDGAREAFQALARDYPNYEDVVERLARLERWQQWYTDGSRAWDDEEWEEVEKAFAQLYAECPEYEDTGQRLTALRDYAQGQQFIDAQDYERAGAAFERVKQIEPEFLQRRLSPVLDQRARQLARDRQWDGARALLERLAPTLPSPTVLGPLLGEVRHPGELYSRANEHLEKGQWDKARKTFQELERQYPGYRDAAEHLEELSRWEDWYAEGCKLWHNEQWDESAEIFGKLVREQPDYKGAGGKLQALSECERLAARGQRLMEDRQRLVAEQAWGEAERTFEEINRRIAGYRDAPVCLLYVQALHAINDKEWGKAERRLEQIAAQKPGYADVDELLAMVRRLQKTIDQFAGGFLRDPWLRWTGSYPYDVFKEAALRVTPASSMKEIMEDASFDQMQKSGMSPDQREAWDVLRRVERRLFADAFLYPVEQVGTLIALLEDEVAHDFQLPSTRSLVERPPQQVFAVLLLWEERREAAAVLERQQGEGPHDARLAHQLGLLYLAWAEELEAQQQTEDAVYAWRQAIGQWAVVLTDGAYWHRWGNERATCYGQQVLAHQLEALGPDLEEELLRRLSENADRHARAKRPAQASTYRQLQLELQAELVAVRLLRELGGIPTARHGRVFCGPRLLDPLELSDALARYVAQLTEEPSGMGAQVEAIVRRLRWYFSSLRTPAVLLEGPQPDPKRSLDLLRSVGRVERDLVYRDLRRRREVSEEDVWYLMAEAHLRMAEERITREGAWDMRATRAGWQAALDLARRWEGEETVGETICTTAMARATSLGRDPQLHSDTSRMDRAIELLETAIDVTHKDPGLRLRLGDLLTARGIHKANHDDHAGAVQDLRRAFSIMPHNHHTRDQYAVALAFLAMDTADDSQSEAKRMLARADRLVKEGMDDRPDYVKYRRTVELIANVRAAIEGQPLPWMEGDPVAELDRVLGDVRGQGTRQDTVSSLLAQANLRRRHGDVVGALETLEQAWELAPEDQDLRDELVDVITERAAQLVTAGATDERQRLVESWRKRFTGRRSLPARLDGYLQWGPEVWHCLRQTGLKYRRGGHQTVLLTYDSAVVGGLTVRLSVEGDAIFLAGSLPPVSEADEGVVLGNLLQCLSEVMFYGPGRVGYAGLAIVCRMPARYLDPRWLKFLISGTYQYADVQPAFLKHAGQLRIHLRSRREVLRLFLPERVRTRDALDQLEALCHVQGWSCSRQDDCRSAFEGPAGKVSVTATEEGVRLAMNLGYPRIDLGRENMFRSMTALSNRLRLGKLGLSERGQVRLMCELPYLDDTGFREATRLFEQRVDEIKEELVQT
jgi:tetratricopeptide (TPR) repeat protein